MKKTACIFIVFAFLLSLFSGCAKPSNELKIGVLPDVDSIPIIVAKHNGYFEDEGVTIGVERFSSAMERDSALQSGAIDGAVSDMLASAFFEEGGFSVKITSMTNGSYKLLAREGIRDVKELAGGSVAISSNTIIEYATDSMLKENGLSPEDAVKTAIPKIPVRLEMLRGGQVDAATLPEPLASSAVKAGAIVLDSTDRLGINPGVILFSAAEADAKSDGIKGFYRAYDRAVQYLQTADISDYIDVLIDEAGFPEDVKGVITLPEYSAAVLPSEQDFNGVMDWLSSKGLIKNEYSYGDLVSAAFAGPGLT